MCSLQLGWEGRTEGTVVGARDRKGNGFLDGDN